MVTSLLAIAANKAGHTTAILDADITGPSIPPHLWPKRKGGGYGKRHLSRNHQHRHPGDEHQPLLDRENDPVVWRGPIIGETVKQFWSDVLWKDVNVMFIDMPPGTGDAR